MLRERDGQESRTMVKVKKMQKYKSTQYDIILSIYNVSALLQII